MTPVTLHLEYFGPYRDATIDFTRFMTTPLFLISGKRGAEKPQFSMACVMPCLTRLQVPIARLRLCDRILLPQRIEPVSPLRLPIVIGDMRLFVSPPRR